MAFPPGPRAPMPLQTSRFIARPVPFMERCRRRYGDTFTVRLPGPAATVFISDPESIKALFKADRVNTIASRRNLVLAPLLGDGSLLLIDGDLHLSRRKLMLPPFHGERMRAYEGVMEEASAREVERWQVGEPLRLHPRMQAITLEVIMRAVFGVSGERRGRLRELLLSILAATRSPLALGLNMPGVRRVGRLGRVRRAIGETDRLLFAEIGERRADPEIESREDILSMLVAARDESGEGMTDRELRDQLMTLLMAGHETTATALAWSFDLLFRHPESLERLNAELETDGHDYLDAVITEALRLRPVVPFVGRDLARASSFAGYELPAGTTVMPSIYLAHTREATFPEPYAFRPERFLDEHETGCASPHETGGSSRSPLASAAHPRTKTYSWIPFGGGTRRCLGASFAQVEMRVVLRTILRTVELRPATEEPEEIVRRNVTLSPRNGTPAVVVRRLRDQPATSSASPTGVPG